MNSTEYAGALPERPKGRKTVPIEHVIKELELNYDQYCAEHVCLEPDSGAAVFESDANQNFAEGFSAAIDFVKSFVKEC